jgi:hypothetical protein
VIQMSDEQIENFLELVEIHYECFQKHYPEYNVTYENVLELNHKKILDIIEELIEGDEEFIDFMLELLMFEYKQILNREGTD